MGKTLDVLFGWRRLNTSKLKACLALATSRLSVLKNLHQSRCSHAQSDVAQYLSLRNREQAIDRAECAIKEQNMYDLFVIAEGYCNLLIQRVSLLDHSNKVCPEELKEAISGLIYVSSRCGELPELQNVRLMFAAQFGKSFVSAASEGCRVNQRVIQKASVEPVDKETKLKMVKDVASERSIPFNLQWFSSSETASIVTEEDVATDKSRSGTPSVNSQASPSVNSEASDYYWKEHFPEKDSRFKDVATAAKAVFDSASFAAAAARAVIDLTNGNGGNTSEPARKGKGKINSPIEEEEEEEEGCGKKTSLDSGTKLGFMNLPVGRSLSVRTWRAGGGS